MNNRLYLSQDVSFAFRQAYIAAGDHQSLKDTARLDPSQQSVVQENFRRITEAEGVIVRSVAIPPLSEGMPASEELKKQA